MKSTCPFTSCMVIILLWFFLFCYFCVHVFLVCLFTISILKENLKQTVYKIGNDFLGSYSLACNSGRKTLSIKYCVNPDIFSHIFILNYFHFVWTETEHKILHMREQAKNNCFSPGNTFSSRITCKIFKIAFLSRP